jgi:hypothetical protein
VCSSDLPGERPRSIYKCKSVKSLFFLRFDKILAKVSGAINKFEEYKKKEDKAKRDEAKAMREIGYLEARVEKGAKKGRPLSSKEAARLNKKNKMMEKKAKASANKLQKELESIAKDVNNVPKLISYLSGRKKKKKVEKKVTKKKTTKKTYKKPTKKVSKKKVSKKKATKKKVAKKVTKKVSVKKSAAKKAAKKASKKAKKSSSKKKKNPVKMFSNPTPEVSENPKKGRKVRKKKKKNSKRSRKAKKSLASQVADMAKPMKKKKKGGRKAKKMKKIKVKALAGHPSKKKKKKKTYKKSNPISLQAIKEKIMKPFGKDSLTNHELGEAVGLLSGGAILKVYDFHIKQRFIAPQLAKVISPTSALFPVFDALVDVLVAVGAGHVASMIPNVGQDAKKGIIGAAVVQLGIKTIASVSTAAGMPMNGIIGVPSMNGIIGVPSMNGIIGVPSMGAMSADFQGMGASGMQDADFGAYYKTVGLEGSYLQAADYDSGSVIPTAPRTPEAFSGFGAYENVEYSDEGEDGDF